VAAGKCFTKALNWYGKCKGSLKPTPKLKNVRNNFDFSKASCENFAMRLYICKRVK
jgi:hypothetical protein